MSRRFGQFASAVLLVCCIWMTCGCDRRKSDPTAAWSAKLTSPEAVFVQLREWYLSHSYAHMGQWLDPATRDEVIELLIAMDELMAANTTAQEVLRTHHPGVDPGQFDMSKLANFLGLFSLDAEFVGERINGDEAVVSFKVGKSLPLKSAEFKLYQGRWVYMPGEGSRDLEPLVRALAKGLTRFATVISKGSQSPEQLESEFRYRVVPAFDAILSSLTPATSPAMPSATQAGPPK